MEFPPPTPTFQLFFIFTFFHRRRSEAEAEAGEKKKKKKSGKIHQPVRAMTAAAICSSCSSAVECTRERLKTRVVKVFAGRERNMTGVAWRGGCGAVVWLGLRCLTAQI